jgi:homoserine kinase
VKLEGHPDNVLPALAGGMTIAMTEGEQVHYKKIPMEAALQLVIAVPAYQLSTHAARAVIPDQVPFQNMVANLQRVSFLVAALYERNYAHLKLAMKDMLVEPWRKQMIPGFDQAVAAAEQAGALATVISGSGPSIAAWTLENQLDVSIAMQQALLEAGVHSEIYVLRADDKGIQYLSNFNG